MTEECQRFQNIYLINLCLVFSCRIQVQINMISIFQSFLPNQIG